MKNFHFTYPIVRIPGDSSMEELEKYVIYNVKYLSLLCQKNAL